MDPTKFVAPDWGRVVSTGGSAAYDAFIPAVMPKALQLGMDTVLLLSEADAALGRLAGAGRLLPDPHLLVNAYMTREAVSSSRIEGTQASVTEVFDAAVTGVSKRNDVREVRNYIVALEHGIGRLAGGFPLSLRLIREMHELLMTGVRGSERTPGEFRRSQIWISSPDNTPRTARFVPPPVDELWPALDDWEKYLHDEAPQLPLLIRCALLHYQFETIHPFLDGNGRLGRLFIVLYLMDRARLPAPLLYLPAISMSASRSTTTGCTCFANAGKSPSGYICSSSASAFRPRTLSSEQNSCPTCGRTIEVVCAATGAEPARWSICCSPTRS